MNQLLRYTLQRNVRNFHEQDIVNLVRRYKSNIYWSDEEVRARDEQRSMPARDSHAARGKRRHENVDAQRSTRARESPAAHGKRRHENVDAQRSTLARDSPAARERDGQSPVDSTRRPPATAQQLTQAAWRRRRIVQESDDDL